MTSIDKKEDPERKEHALRAFLREKERFATLMDAIHIVSKDAGREFRVNGWGRDDG